MGKGLPSFNWPKLATLACLAPVCFIKSYIYSYEEYLSRYLGKICLTRDERLDLDIDLLYTLVTHLSELSFRLK